MKIAFVSDIHANLEALEAVLADIDGEGADEIVCLGDLVGYGPDPNPCVQRIRETCAVTILGNHDQAAVGELSTGYFNEYARIASDWTAQALDPGAREFLALLPDTRRYRGLRLVHACPREPRSWTYVLSLEEAARQFRGFDERLCFIGHSHLPVVLEEGNPVGQAVRYPPDEPLKLLPDRRYIVNVGSVGQPRDRDPRAAYVWYDTGLDVVRLRRVEYPVARVQEKIREQGLPEYLAARLERGM